MSQLSRLALLLLAGLSSAAWGQVVTATLRGSVIDPAGAVVPNATVTATNTNRGTSISRRSGESGLVTLPSLPLGNYTIAVEAPGIELL
jgi:hypothetical protein